MHMRMHPHTCQRHDYKVLRSAVCSAAQCSEKCPPGWLDSKSLQQGSQLAPIWVLRPSCQQVSGRVRICSSLTCDTILSGC
jgi:hypothetical protein